MYSLSESGKPIEFVEVTDELKKRDAGSSDSFSYITELIESVPTAANIEYYCKIVEEKSILRKLIRTATNIVTTTYAEEDDVETVLDQAEKTILEVSNRKNSNSFKDIQDVLVEVYANIEKLHHQKGDITGIPTGFRDLDRITSGFQRNDLIIVAARPSVGKTAFALNIAQNVAIRTNENVAVFSLEMGADQLVQRMLCAEGNIDSQRMRSGNLEGDDWEKLTMAM